MARWPHELEFVVEVAAGPEPERQAEFDVYHPADAFSRSPVVVIVPGMLPAAYPVRPWDWPSYRGYGRLAAGLGLVAVVADVRFHEPSASPAGERDLARIVAAARSLDGVDADRVAVWAFSGGAMLVGPWLAASPDWLRCLALTYPFWLTAPPVAPGRPLVLTRVGLEEPERQAQVDAFLSGADVRVVDVPNGHHGFDTLDHTDESRHAVLEVAELVAGHLQD